MLFENEDLFTLDFKEEKLKRQREAQTLRLSRAETAGLKTEVRELRKRLAKISWTGPIGTWIKKLWD